jgi:6-phosphogluconolactonase (cycloisomerase 2 family)
VRNILSAAAWAFLLGVFSAPIAAQSSSPTYLFLLEDKGVPTGTIHGFNVNTSTGALSEVPGSPFSGGLGPAQIVIDPTGRFLYVANQLSKDVTGFSIDAATGALTSLPGSPFFIGSEPVTMGADPTGRFLYVFAATVSFGISQESLFEYTIDPVSGVLTLTSSSPVTWESIPGILITSIAFSPAGNMAYLGQSASNSQIGPILICTVDFTTGTLTQVASAQPASAQADHLGLAPGGNFLFSTSGPNHQVDAFTIGATGMPSEISGSPYAVGNVAAAIGVHPSGNFLYVVNENEPYQAGSNPSQYAGSVSAFGIGATTGALTPISGSPFAAGINAASIVVDPTGSLAYLASTNYVTGTYSAFAQIQGFSINSSSGALSPFPAAAWTDSTQSNGSQLAISVGATAPPNPVPMISSLSPPSVAAAGPAFTLQINGANFVSGSRAYFAGQLRNTARVSPEQLNVSIPASDITNGGAAVVFVFTPLPGGGASTSVEFTVTSPIPNITALSPASLVMGSSNAGIGVGGANFLTSSIINFNGSPLPATIYVSPTLLRALIPPADIVSAGTATITVTNPSNNGVGGGTSNPLTVAIVPPVAKFSVTSISPTSAQAGGPAFTLTVNGSGFVAASQSSAGTQVSFNLMNEPTTYVSSTQLTAVIPTSAIAIAGNPYVIVTNPDGTTSTPITFTVGSPAPGWISVSPSSLSAGSNALTLNVTGSGFQPNSIVVVNNSPRPTTYVSSTLLQVTLLPGDIAQGTTLSIAVVTPPPGGGVSQAISVPVMNPQPGGISLSPQSFTVGSGASQLIVTGGGFVTNSVISVNGSPVATTYQGSAALTTTLPPGDFAQAGTLSITVANLSPGGGTSASASLVVNNLVPGVTSVAPGNLLAGSKPVTLSITGTGFMPTSVALVNSTPRQTSSITSTSLQATLLASDLAQGGTLSIAVSNPAPGGGPSAPYSIEVADYVLVPTSASKPVTAGQPAVFTFTVSSKDGTFSSPVTIGVASQLPAGAVAPPATTLPDASGQTVTLSVTTTARTSASPVSFPRDFRTAFQVLCMIVGVFVLIWFLLRSPVNRFRRLAPQFLLALLLLIAGGLAACGGLASGPSSDPQPNPSTGTPAGTYPITVTATSGSVSHSATVTLTVM